MEGDAGRISWLLITSTQRELFSKIRYRYSGVPNSSSPCPPICFETTHNQRSSYGDSTQGDGLCLYARSSTL
ncbi:hypothetical protein CERZMDRAFT_103661 [Cercospora zeae-maydis SCOH1-5]|uniref:Uncharacterized protein n=1 Tax=Cercospora zeae-maydis SCOH1-5 TaxID=717836 RepID=A0A6A6EYG0_9PEZI|nr:hypothetical protein CERZMDRAFT_103661 [Cercospora zeae-maydis SCOH1-5]